MEAVVVQSRECTTLSIHGQGQCVLPHRLLAQCSHRRWPPLDHPTCNFQYWYACLSAIVCVSSCSLITCYT
jgi:hypothetical protein